MPFTYLTTSLSGRSKSLGLLSLSRGQEDLVQQGVSLQLLLYLCVFLQFWVPNRQMQSLAAGLTLPQAICLWETLFLKRILQEVFGTTCGVEQMTA